MGKKAREKKRTTIPAVAGGSKPHPEMLPNSGVTHSDNEMSPKTPGVDAIRAWLITEISRRAEIEAQALDVHEPVVRYGINSVVAAGVAADLAAWLGLSLLPTVVYDYPTIEALAAHLARKTGQTAPASTPEVPAGHRYARKPGNPAQSLTAETEKTDNGREPIAIVGYGCRFPGASSPDAYWKLLRAAGDAITEMPKTRWDVDRLYDPNPATPGRMSTRWGGFIENVDQFDASFFGIAPREAESMDPQQRLVLEVAWEALENAGQAPTRLAGSQTGVFVGISTFDYTRLQLRQAAGNDAYSGTGNSLSIAAHRLSYFLDLHGPSFSVDTACSSSLVAVHQACQSLRLGESDLALAGGVNLMLAPDMTIIFSQARMMAPDGHCKTFDADANGYVRSEGCGMVVLKRYSDALRDGDRVLALIRGSAVNQDGRSNGLTAPNGLAQQAVVRQALHSAGISPAQISYVEAHGTGTALGDPIEVNSLREVLLENRPASAPCWIGSAKANIGHLESAAGVAGLIKTILMLQHREIPPQLNFKRLNPLISLEGTPLAIPAGVQPWLGGTPRLAGISSFSFGGTNAHVVIEEAPQEKEAVTQFDRGWNVLTVSAKTPNALQDLVRGYSDYIRSAGAALIPGEICHSANAGRAHFPHRLAVEGRSTVELCAGLEAYLAGREADGLLCRELPGGAGPQAAFLFTGQGSQYIGMGRRLYDTQEVFRAALDRCAEILRPYMDVPLLSVMYPDEGAATSLIDNTAYTQPALFSIEYALARLWSSWGIEPAAVMGHSVGEYVAACVAGVFTLEDGLRLIAHRARLMQALPEGGAMAAIAGAPESVRSAIETAGARVDIAALNGPENVVVSGAADAVDKVVKEFDNKGVKATRLKVSHAFHSYLMDDMLAEFEREARAIRYHIPRIRMISNVTGKQIGAEIACAQYWVDHVRMPVQFAAGVDTLRQLGHDLLVEIGPTPVLLGMAVTHTDAAGARLPSLRRGMDDWRQLLHSAAELYVRGAPIKWQEVDRGHAYRHITLPTYPFQRQRYWVPTGNNMEATTAVAASGLLQGQPSNPLLGERFPLAGTDESRFTSRLSKGTPAFIDDHQVYGVTVVPATGYLEMASSAIAGVSGSERYALANVAFQKALILEPDAPRIVQTILQRRDGHGYQFQIFSRAEQIGADNAETAWQLHVSGEAIGTADDTGRDAQDIPALQRRLADEIPVAEYYRTSSARGLAYGPCFQAIEKLWRNGNEALGWIAGPADVLHDVASYRLHPALLDACLQVLGAMLPAPGDTDSHLSLPVGLERMQVHRRLENGFWCHARIRPESGPGSDKGFTADIRLIAVNGELLASLTGVQMWQVSRDALLSARQETFQDWLYKTEWLEQEQTTPSAGGAGQHAGVQSSVEGSWLILADKGGFGRRVGRLLEAEGARCFYVSAAAAYRKISEREYEIAADNGTDYDHLLSSIGTAARPLRGVAHLWSIDVDSIDGDRTGAGASGADNASAGLESPLRRVCGSTLHLAQALIAGRSGQLPILALVTRGATGAGAPDNAAGVVQASLSGMTKVIGLEHPALHCVQIDLESRAREGEAQQLVRALATTAGGEQVAFRDDKRYVARLARMKKPAAGSSQGKKLRQDATYLITGGLGGLGLLAADWMVSNGARHVILLARRDPDEAARKRIENMENAGAAITLSATDVSSATQVAALLKDVERTMPPLAGIIHAAGVVDDGVMLQQTWSRFAAVMAPKVQGAWNLHVSTRHLPLDFFVLYSSVASLFGLAGQANYAAANASLDALARYRRAQGLAALSINWGNWSNVGMAHKLGLAGRFEQQGMGGIAPEQGIKVLARLLSVDEANVGAVPVNWAVHSEQYLAGEEPPFLSALIQRTGREPAEKEKRQDISAALREAPAEESRELLLEYLHERATRVLKLNPEQSRKLRPSFENMPLNDLGLDSLMGIELRNRITAELKVDIPMHVLIGGSSVAQLIAMITSQLALKNLVLREPVSEEESEDMEVITL